MSDQPEKLDLASASISDVQRAKLRELFPETFTEGGKIDFDKLKRTLGETIDAGKERFGLTWPGKADCLKTIQQPSTAALCPARSESVNFDTTGNLIIEGDNLEVLKLLQKAYLGAVKVIYIDPPYNTGNDFIYPDNYSESLDTYLRYTGQVDSEGRKYSANTETDGRFHSKWLNMMYPRLHLARNLLRQDGVIFVSIDDAEADNLRKLCNEIFGEENFVAQMVWEGAFKNDARQIGVNHEYIIVYARSRASLPAEWSIAKDAVDPVLAEVARLKKEFKDNYEAASTALAAWFQNNKATPSFAHRRFRYIDQYGAYKEDDPTAPGGRRFDLINPKTGKIIPLRPNRGWSFDQKRFEELVEAGRITFVTEDSIMVRRYLHETDRMTPQSVLYQPARSASERLSRLMGAMVFDFPKDETVIRQLIEMASAPDSLILDFFAGSGTTGHAVLDLNRQDGGTRKFILVQLPEPTAHKDFQTIADITKERVRRVIKLLDEDDSGKLALDSKAKPDHGFKVFKLRTSNFKAWNTNVPKEVAALTQQLEMHVQHIVDGRTQNDLLFEILLKSGFSLNTPIEVLTLAGKSVYSIEQGAMLVCLDNELTPAVIQAMADRQPVRVICLDAGFAGNDQLKTNAVQQMRARRVTKFQTV
jgi:adenine-specific DNA-methyltransferase